jgi:class 3 adenylate cyclase/predicted ATPase
MDFLEVLEQAREVLQSKGRITYRTLKRQFALDDDALEDLKFELISGQRIAVDEDGQVLVWVGAAPVPSAESRVPSPPQSPAPNPQPPVSYTPAHLAERIRAEQAALEARGSADGERKIITALFADLKGSTALIEGLDPEEARAIIDPALQLMMDAVHRYDGYVAQALGDGIFALFGAPLAHEDHPQRALYAALRMQEAMRRYADTLRAKGSPPLLMRVGINTGEVVVRSIRKDDLHTDYVPVGHSTNLAARMEQMAAPGSIVVSAYTHRLTDGYFAFKDLGLTQIKGVEEPLNIYEVLGVGQLRTRLQVSTTRRGLTRFVGRQSEMEQLNQALEQAKAGHGQIVGTMGEPGLGKSRLFHEFVGATGRSSLLVLQAYSVSHGKATAYLPVIELLKSYFRIESQDDERTRREKVTGKVLNLDRSLEDTLPYLFALLGIEEQPSPLQQMDAQIRRRRTFEALKKLFLRESLNQPLILIFEDLHWIDGETQGFLDVLSESVASAKILLLTNYRPEYRHEWGQKTYYTQLRLAPLGKAEADEFLSVLLGETVGATGRSPLHALKQLILEKTEGTPFFMEEVVQELREQGVLTVGAHGRAPLPTDLHIPTTVQGVLAARIDRLAPDEKALLQQLAVIGREFPLSLVRHVVPQSEDELYRVLASLQRKEFLYEQPAFPEPDYIFKHALTQEVAYGTVLHEHRKALHERTARALEALYSASLDEHYGDLAHHYTRGGNTQKAVEYLGLAGQQAVQRSANTEAISHFNTALELLKTLPDTQERIQQELLLQMALVLPTMILHGYGSPAIEAVSVRARELCRRVGESSQISQALLGLQRFYYTRVELQSACELGEQLLRLAQRMDDTSLLLEAHGVLGAVHFSRGELLLAREHWEQVLDLYRPQQHRTHIFVYGTDPSVVYEGLLAWNLSLLGYPDQALRRVQAVLSRARELAHPNTLAFALVHTAWIQLHRHEARDAQRRTEELITLSTERGLPYWAPVGIFSQGWALAELGRQVEGLALMHEGVTAKAAMGSPLFSSLDFAQMAEVYGQVGQAEEGLRRLTEALAFVNKTGERFYEAELYRLKGELTLQQQFKVQSSEFKVPNTQHPTPSTQSEAEACFLKAIDIAQRQQAKSLELRAVMSLVRLRQQQALGQSAKSKAARAGNTEHATRTTHHETRLRLDDARTMLASVYNWFTEGFDTKDLKEAKALLDDLG